MKKLVKESLYEIFPDPSDAFEAIKIADIVLDIAKKIKDVLKIDISPLKNFDKTDSGKYVAMFPNIAEKLTLDDQEDILNLVKEFYPKYSDSIEIIYDSNIKGILIVINPKIINYI